MRLHTIKFDIHINYLRFTCRYKAFSLQTDTNGKMIIAFLCDSSTLFNTSSSATRVLPALVGAEYSKLPPAGNTK